MFKLVFSEMLKGKSLLRTLTNLWISKIKIDGNGIDLGARNNHSSYFRFIQKGENCDTVFTDLDPQGDNVLQVNLEKEIPVEENSQDYLLLMHVMEHLFDYQTCVNECYRVLKPGSRLIGSVPFLYQVHLDPDDNFRYTRNGLEKIFNKAGFSNIEIFTLGVGPISAGLSQYAAILKIKFLVFSVTWFGILFDRFLQKLAPNHHRVKSENFPLAYGFVVTK